MVVEESGKTLLEAKEEVLIATRVLRRQFIYQLQENISFGL
jgi:hypothetical protein